jgi:hypothetical protein
MTYYNYGELKDAFIATWLKEMKGEWVLELGPVSRGNHVCPT